MSAAALALAGFSGKLAHWPRHLLALGAAAAGLLLLFAHDAAHMATIWWTSSTFNHCLLIVPIVGWLAWQRAPALRTLTPSTWTPGLAIVGAGAFGWLLGDAAGVSLFRHAGLIVMLQGVVAALIGRTASRVLLFPLLYALFLIPASEELVPALQGITARISMALLGLAGIPAHMEGVFITTPGGYFEVAEACSGVKFLVAMFALGVLVAHVGFRSRARRLAFVAAAVIVPVLANGVRAFATIYVAGRTSMETAAGFDHIVYGWFFFGIVIAALLGGAWRFFDRDPDALPEAPRDAPAPAPALPLMLSLCLSLAAVPLLWSGMATARASDAVATFQAPVLPGWSRVARDRGLPWSPGFVGADRLLVQRYRDRAGRKVDLAIAAYARQSEGRELVGYGQGAVAPDGGWSWSQSAAPPAGGRADRIVNQGVTRDVLSFYRVDSVTTGNDAEVKLLTLKSRLLGRPAAGVAILVSAEATGGAVATRAVLDDFLLRLGPVDRVADRALGRDGAR